MTRDELISELQKLPTNCEIRFKAETFAGCDECWGDTITAEVKFDHINFSPPAVIFYDIRVD